MSVYEGTKATPEMLVEYLEKTGPVATHKPVSPNHAAELTTAAFRESAAALAEPFSEAMKAYYAE